MVPPPWHLVSPTGVLCVVPNAEALKELAKNTPGLIDGSRTNLLAVLVGAGRDSLALADLPLHKKMHNCRRYTHSRKSIPRVHNVPAVGVGP